MQWTWWDELVIRQVRVQELDVATAEISHPQTPRPPDCLPALLYDSSRTDLLYCLLLLNDIKSVDLIESVIHSMLDVTDINAHHDTL